MPTAITMPSTVVHQQRIAEGHTAQLACSAATALAHRGGSRLADVIPANKESKLAESHSEAIWRKNGLPIRPNVDSNLILANDGSLIISAARLTDSGDYTCLRRTQHSSQNDAKLKATDDDDDLVAADEASTSTQIIVYVDGEWSPWSEWHGMCPQLPVAAATAALSDDSTLALSPVAAMECSVLRGQVAMTRGGTADAVQRVLPRQRRMRECNNPASLNGGAPCRGANEEFRMCPHACKLDGEWSSWSAWSICDSATCRRKRWRKCDAPTPANGGADCAAGDVGGEELQNCTLPTSFSENDLIKRIQNDESKVFRDESGFEIPRHCLTAGSTNPFRSIDSSVRVEESGEFNKADSLSEKAKKLETVSATNSRLKPHKNGLHFRPSSNRNEALRHKSGNNVFFDKFPPLNSNLNLRQMQAIDEKFDTETSLNAAYSPQVYVLASMGCVAFLLVVIALLIGALLCTSTQKRRTRKPSDTSNNAGSGGVKSQFDFGATETMRSATNEALKSASTFMGDFDAAGRVFVGENGEKKYFPIATNENDKSRDIHTVLLSERHQRYFLGNTSASRASTPAVNAATRFFTLASAKSTPGHFVRHTASAATTTTNAGVGGSGLAYDATTTETLENTITATIKPHTRSGNGYFHNNRQLAESRVPLIAGGESSPSNGGGSSASSAGGSASGTTPYRQSHQYYYDRQPQSQPQLQNEINENGSLLMRRFTNSQYYNQKANPSSDHYGESEADNYATLYDYVISAPAQPSSPQHGSTIDIARSSAAAGERLHYECQYESQRQPQKNNNDSGNHSTDSDHYLPDLIVANESDINYGTRRGRYGSSVVNDITSTSSHHYYLPTDNINGKNNEKMKNEYIRDDKDDATTSTVAAPTIVAAQVDSESTRIELKRSGVALTIGELSFADERTVFLASSDSCDDRPTLNEEETWLSSVISYGLCYQDDDGVLSYSPSSSDSLNRNTVKSNGAVAEYGTTTTTPATATLPLMRRPVVLSFEHCASLFPKDNWQFVLYGDLSNTIEDDGIVADSTTTTTYGNFNGRLVEKNDNGDERAEMNERRARQTEAEDEKEDNYFSHNINNNNNDSKMNRMNVNRIGNYRRHGVNGGNWEALCTIGEENLNTRVYVQLERERCHVMTESFGRYLLAGRPRRPNVAAQKRVHLAAYCSIVRATTTVQSIENANAQVPSHHESDSDHDDYVVTALRVYCVPEMQMCIESVRKQEDEEPLHGVLLAEAENFPMLPAGALCCCLEEVGDGYALQPECSQYLEIPDAQHLWCAQNGLHFALNLRKISADSAKNNSACAATEERGALVRGRIVIYQKGNPSERQILAFQLDYNQLPANRRKRQSASPSSISQRDGTLAQPALSSSTLNATSTIVSRRFQLSFVLKQKLCEHFDRAPSDGAQKNSAAGWLALALKLGFERYVQYFGTHPGCSPTSLVLDLWEARVGASERALLDLLQTLRVLGRADAVALLEPHINSNAYASKTNGSGATITQQRLNAQSQPNKHKAPPIAPPHRNIGVHHRNPQQEAQQQPQQQPKILSFSSLPYVPRLPPPPPPPKSVLNTANALLNVV